MIEINKMAVGVTYLFKAPDNLQLWQVTGILQNILVEMIGGFGHDYIVKDGIAIHSIAVIEKIAVLRVLLIVCIHCFIRVDACLCVGVFLDENVEMGKGCEIKTSMIFNLKFLFGRVSS